MMALAKVSPALRRFAGSLSWTLAGHALVRGAMLLAGFGVVRMLGVDAFADFTLYLFSINLLAAFSDMGVSYAVMKYGVAARVQNQKRSIDRLAATLQISLVGGVLSFAIILHFTQVSAWAGWKIAALGLAGLAVAWQVSFGAVLISMRRLRQVFIGNAIFAAVLLAGTAASGWLLSQVPVIIAYPIGAIAQCLYQAALVNRLLEIKSTVWFTPRLHEMRSIIGMIGFIAPTSLIASALPWVIANIQLAQGTGKTALAVFGAGTMLFGLTMIIPGRIAQLFFIDQLEQSLNGNRPRQFRIADLNAAGFSTAAAAGLIVLLYVVGNDLIKGFGKEIAQHFWSIFALSAVALVACPYQIAGNRIVSSGWHQLWLPVTIVQAIALLAFMWIAPAAPTWNPALAYWISYATALGLAIPIYLFATQRARA